MIKNFFHIALKNLKKHCTYAALNALGLGLSIACALLIFLLVRHHFSYNQFHKKLDLIGLMGTESR